MPNLFTVAEIVDETFPKIRNNTIDGWIIFSDIVCPISITVLTNLHITMDYFSVMEDPKELMECSLEISN